MVFNVSSSRLGLSQSRTADSGENDSEAQNRSLKLNYS